MIVLRLSIVSLCGSHSGPVVLKWEWEVVRVVAVGPGGSGVRVAKA